MSKERRRISRKTRKLARTRRTFKKTILVSKI